MTVAPIGAKAGSLAKRDAVTMTGTSTFSLTDCANAGAMGKTDKPVANTSGFHAAMLRFDDTDFMMSVSIRSIRPASPRVEFNKRLRKERSRKTRHCAEEPQSMF